MPDMMSNDMEDNELVSLCLKGDVGAFEALVRRHEKRMLNTAFRMTGDFEEACEAVQDAFVQAYRNLEGFKGEAMFSTWLCAIVMNLSRNRLKQMKVRRVRESLSVDDPVLTEGGAVRVEPASAEPTALDRLEQEETHKVVWGCIEALDEEMREVIVLRDIQGFSYEEIGGILGIAGGTVKSRIYRAREDMRDCLKRSPGGFK